MSWAFHALTMAATQENIADESGGAGMGHSSPWIGIGIGVVRNELERAPDEPLVPSADRSDAARDR